MKVTRDRVQVVAGGLHLAALGFVCVFWPAARTWLNVHLWAPMWPNMFAPSVITIVAVIWSHIKQHRQNERRHEELKQHVTTTAGGASGQDNG